MFPANQSVQIPENYFAPIGNTKPYVKLAVMGFGGEGKTTTAMLVAIGLAKAIGTTKPVVIMNSELSVAPFKQKFLDAGLPLPLVRDSRSYVDLLDVMKMMRAGLSEILVIDEIYRYHVDFKQGYKNRPTTWDPPRPARTRLDPGDREMLGEEWNLDFGQHFVEDPYHIIMCGRAGYNYDDERDEETGRMAQFKGATKMKGDSQLSHLPDLLIEMEQIDIESPEHGKEIYRRATVRKDRWDRIDGKVFRNPDFDDFLPHIECVLDRPVPRTTVPGKDSTARFWNEDDRRDYRRNCEKAAEEVEGLIHYAIPGSSAKEKQHRAEIIFKTFGTHSDQEWKSRDVEELRAACPRIQEMLVGLGYAEWLKDGEKPYFHVKGLPVPTREQLAGGFAQGYEQITPKPLREAHEGLDKIEQEGSKPKRKRGAIPDEAAETFLKTSRDMGWTETQVTGLLATIKVESINDIPKAEYDALYLKLLDQDTRDSFPKEVEVSA